MWRWFMSQLLQWLRKVLPREIAVAYRTERRRPVQLLLTILVLACPLCVLTLVVTTVNAVMLRPWMVEEPESLFLVKGMPLQGESYGTITAREFEYLEVNSTLATLASWVRGGGRFKCLEVEIPNLQSSYVTSHFQDVVGMRVQTGRRFTAADFLPATDDFPVVISDRVWRTYFGGDPLVVGRVATLGAARLRVIGVTAADFRDPSSSIGVGLWLPFSALTPVSSGQRNSRRSDEPIGAVVGKLHHLPGRSEAYAQLRSLDAQFRSGASLPSRGLVITSTRPVSAGPLPQTSGVSVAAAMCLALMLLACSNVGLITVVRSASREAELVLRLALGASRASLVAQCAVSASLWVLMASSAAVWVALATPKLLPLFGVSKLLQAEFFKPDRFVFAAIACLALLIVALTGAGPAFSVTRRLTLSSLSTNRTTSSAANLKLRKLLLAIQVCLAVAIVLDASFLSRGIQRSLADTGIDLDGVFALDAEFASSDARRDALASLARSAPASGVAKIAFADIAPLFGGGASLSVKASNEPGRQARDVLVRPVSPSYFEVLSIPIVRGRTFSPDPLAGELVISQTAADSFWPAGDALGKTLWVISRGGAPQSHLVVGIAKAVPLQTLDQRPAAIYQMSSYGGYALVHRSSVSAAVGALQSLGAKRVVTMALADMAEETLAPSRRGELLVWCGAWLAILMGAIGLSALLTYAAASYSVELAIRAALGAPPRALAYRLLAEMAKPLLLGLFGGLVISAMSWPLLRRLLYGLSPLDPLAYVWATLLLLAVAAAAVAVPMRTALRINIASHLRG